jgi:hypothetical protein
VLQRILLASVVVLNTFFHNQEIEKELLLWFKERHSIERRHYNGTPT